MTKFIIGLVLTISFSSYSQTTQSKLEDGLLWEITHPESKTKSYLFGTIHIIDADKFLFPKKLEKLIKKADTIVLELADMNEADILESAKLKTGSFFDFLNAEQEDSLYVFLKENTFIDSATFTNLADPFKPLFVSQLIGQFQGLQNVESYELTMFQLIKDHDLKAIGFETIEQQFGFFDVLDSTDQARMVMDVVNGSGDDLLEKLEDIYLKQNIDDIYSFLQSSDDWSSSYNDVLILQRNKNWVNQMSFKLKNSNYFIAVGAGHLGGPDGLVRLLQNEGYQLNPIVIE